MKPNPQYIGVDVITDECGEPEIFLDSNAAKAEFDRLVVQAGVEAEEGVDYGDDNEVIEHEGKRYLLRDQYGEPAGRWFESRIEIPYRFGDYMQEVCHLAVEKQLSDDPYAALAPGNDPNGSKIELIFCNFFQLRSAEDAAQQVFGE